MPAMPEAAPLLPVPPFPVAPAPPPKPLRLESIALCDFRAFAGPSETLIDLGGNNLLLYGENGAGKSSLFEALRGMFARRADTRLFKAEKNVFSGLPDADARVVATFNDGGVPARWTIASHPGKIGDPRIVSTALRAASLDYRALLDTNYSHGRDEPNLFDIAMDLLLADYPLASGATLGELWTQTQAAKPKVGRNDTNVKAACAVFNVEFAAAVDALLPFARALLSDLLKDAISLDNLVYGTVTYANVHQKRDRLFNGRLLRPVLSYRAHGLKRPQLFLNEARQSALALAIYLAGRLACTQTAPPEALKLLVLDDVLIGLDQSNRLPVLDLLMTRFPGWQIVLLTHDRVWFDMARIRLKPNEHWRCVELLETDDPSGKQPPAVRVVGNDAAADALARADQLLAAGFLPAAANYTRIAFEQAVRAFCDSKAIAVRYRMNQRQLKLEELLNGMRSWIKSNGAKKYGDALEGIELFQQAVMNPLSHAGSPEVVRAEVRAAIAAVRIVLQAMHVK